MSNSQLENLISHVVDGDASSDQWNELNEFAENNPQVWRELANTMRDHQSFTRGVNATVAAADNIPLPENIVEPSYDLAPEDPTLRPRRLGHWGGWAVAAMIALAWVGGINLTSVIAAVLLVHKTPEDHLDDLLQDVAMTLVSKIDTLRETGNIRAWLRTVAVNAARASARRGRSRPRPNSLEYEPEANSIEAVAGGQVDEEASRLMNLSKQLPETYREPLMLRAIHGMRGTFRVIARRGRSRQASNPG